MVGWWSACQLGWLDGARDVWLVSWLVVEDGEACREAVCLDDWLVVEDGEAGREAVWVVELSGWMVRLVVRLSPWMVDWCCGCLGGRAVSLDGETGREAVSLDGWLVVEDGQACREAWLAWLVVRLSA